MQTFSPTAEVIYIYIYLTNLQGTVQDSNVADHSVIQLNSIGRLNMAIPLLNTIGILVEINTNSKFQQILQNSKTRWSRTHESS